MQIATNFSCILFMKVIYYNKGESLMSKKDKLIERLLRKPKDFTFDEMESLLSYFGYELK